MKHQMLDVIIVGAGGFAREIVPWLWECFSPDEIRLKGFLARNQHELRNFELGASVIGDPESYMPHKNDRFILAIGDIDARRRTVEALTQHGASFLTVIHPTAVVAKSAVIGEGAVLYPFVTVSNGANLADFVHLSLYASAGHDSNVGRFCLLSPYATLNGFAVLKEEVFMGSHSVVGPGHTVERESRISANTSVLHDISALSFVHGVPGRSTKRVIL